MTGFITTHVLDTARGMPGDGMRLELSRRGPQGWQVLSETSTNGDGRTDEPLVAAGRLEAGEYCLRFDVAGYFARHGVPTSDPPYLASVPIEFTIADPDAHYHVPLILAPWGYTTYRGS